MTAKDEILARIGAPRQVAPAPRNYRSAGSKAAGDPSLLELFTERLLDYKAEVHHCTPATLAATLAGVIGVRSDSDNTEVVMTTSVLSHPEPHPHSPPGTVIVPAGLSWLPSDLDVVVDDGHDAAALDEIDTVLTGCAAACAETGTIALDGSPDQGRRAITLVPDRHICVVHASQVVETVPELLARLDPQRPLTLISGPSATSDIELQRVEGVHGPRTLIVLLVAP